METYLKFYTQVGEKYPEETIIYRSLRGMLRKKFILAQITKWQGSLLEIGCNVGTYLNAYEGGKKVGVDISYPLLRQLKEKSAEQSVGVMDAQEIAVKQNQFDHILCSEVLEHLSNPQEAMKEIGRILKPGGTALITTPNYRGKRPTWISVGALSDYGISGVKEGQYFHTAFHPKELEQMSILAGLEIIESGTIEKEVKYAAKIPALFFIIIRFLNRKTFRNVEIHRKNERFFNQFQVWCYRFAWFTGIHFLLMAFVKEGVRSFVLLRKPFE